MKRIAVVLAMKSERYVLEKALLRAGFNHTGQWTYQSATAQVTIVSCGVGAKKTRILEKNRDTFNKCDAVFIAGLAGGINPLYRIGDCLVPEKISLLERNGDSFNQDNPLFARVRKIKKIPFKNCAVLSTVNHLVRREEKETLAMVDAVDMESYRCMKWMTANAIPVVCVRIIGDSRSDYIPHEEEILQCLHWSFGWMLKRLIRNPIQGCRLILFILRTRRALAACARYLVRIITSL